MELAESVRAALEIMRESSALRWDDVPVDRRVTVDEHEALAFIRHEKRKDTTIAVCDACGRWQVAPRPMPKRCLLTLRCPGTPERIG